MSNAIEKLKQIGRHSLDGRNYLNYADYGISFDHLDELIALAQTVSTENETLDDLEAYVSIHAWRALAQMRDLRAVPVLIDLYRQAEDCDWVLAEMAGLLAQFGEPILPQLEQLMSDRSIDTYMRSSAATALTQIAEQRPEMRTRCVAMIVDALADFDQEDPELNGLLLCELVKMKAIEQAPLIQTMFEKNCVDWSMVGDWEEVQIELGLLDKRSSPKPNFNLWGRTDAERAEKKERLAMMDLYLQSRNDDEMEEEYYRLRIELYGVTPPIWRQMELSSKTSLTELHRFLQAAMGWENCHAHAFINKLGHYFVDRHAVVNESDDIKYFREDFFVLSTLVREPSDSFCYHYDFGDNWRHTVTLEAVRPWLVTDPELPVCVDGARSCPPEDCGGVPGYARLLEILADPAHPEYEEMREWAGDEYDPEVFAIEDTNMLLELAVNVEDEDDNDDHFAATTLAEKNKKKKVQRKKQKQARKAQRQKKKR